MNAEIYYYDNPHPSLAEEDFVRDLWHKLRADSKPDVVQMSKAFFKKHYIKVRDTFLVGMKPIDYAERLFADYNCEENPLASEENQARLKQLGVKHTSMSVGDIIIIDDVPHIVANTGFHIINFVEKIKKPKQRWRTFVPDKYGAYGKSQLWSVMNELMSRESVPSFDYINGVLSCEKVLGDKKLWFWFGRLLIVEKGKTIAKQMLELDDYKVEEDNTITMRGKRK